jgi:hypothetical protein
MFDFAVASSALQRLPRAARASFSLFHFHFLFAIFILLFIDYLFLFMPLLMPLIATSPAFTLNIFRFIRLMLTRRHA